MEARTIWKYHLTDAKCSLDMPQESIILSAHEQRGEIMIWAMINPNNAHEVRTFHVVGTGWACCAEWEYIDTVHLLSEGLVFHIFEEQRANERQ